MGSGCHKKEDIEFGGLKAGGRWFLQIVRMRQAILQSGASDSTQDVANEG